MTMVEALTQSKIWLWTAIVVLAVIGVAVVFFFLKHRRDSNELKPPIPTVDLTPRRKK